VKTRRGIQQSRRLRRLARRALYSVVPLILLLAGAETALRLIGYEGQPDREVSWCREQAFDPPPFLSAMTLDRVPQAYVATPLPAQPRPYPAVKRPHERRVFVLGGSAAHGYGFSRNGSFAGRLEGLAGDTFPGLDVQVINMGVIAASSQQVLQLGKEILAEQQPDTLIVYSGNNELLELWDWRQFLSPAQHRLYVASLRWNLRLSGSRTFRWLRDRLHGRELPAWGQTEYTREQMLPWEQRAPLTDRDRAYARETFRHNIGRLLELAADSDVPVVLSTVPANWSIEPGQFPLPGHERHRDVEALFLEAERGLQSAQGAASVAESEKLFDDAFDQRPLARTHWWWATLYREQGYPEQALEHYLEAVRLDENPNRAPPFINDEIRALAERPGVTFVDGAAEVVAMAPDGIPSYAEIFDHCHPTLEAHWTLAAALTGALTGLWSGDADPGAPDPRLVAARGTAALVRPSLNPARVEDYLGMPRIDDAWHYGGDPESAGPLEWAAARERIGERPQDPAALNLLGVVGFHHHSADCGRGRPCLQDAADAFRRALDLDPDHCAARANLGRLLVQVGRTADGLAELEAATRCDPADTGTAALIERVRAWSTGF
jgi:tetratricopeptide (TPR) repeat protein